MTFFQLKLLNTINLYKLVQTCANLCKLVQTCANLCILAQTCTNFCKLVQTCANLCKLAQTFANLRKLGQTCSSVSGLLVLWVLALTLALVLHFDKSPTIAFIVSDRSHVGRLYSFTSTVSKTKEIQDLTRYSANY